MMIFRVVFTVALALLVVDAAAAAVSAATAHATAPNDGAEIDFDMISQLNSASNGLEALAAMDSIIFRLSQKREHALKKMNLPRTFDASQIRVNREETTLHHRNEQALAVSTLTPCDGVTVTDITIGSAKLTYNYETKPSMPTKVADVGPSIVTDLQTPSMCVYFKVDGGALSLNADATGTKAATSIKVKNPSGVTGDTTCSDCYAYLGMNLSFKMDCTIDATTPSKSKCTTQFQTGGVFNYGFDFSVKDLGVTAAKDVANIYTGTKTVVFFDPKTQITISATPTIDLGFTGTIQSTGTSKVTSSLKSTASLQTDVKVDANGVTVATEAKANVVLTPFTITSTAAATADFDFHLKFMPTIQWQITCGKMAVVDKQANGASLVINLSNPYVFDFVFTKKGTTYSSGHQAMYGSTLNNIAFYLGAFYVVEPSSTSALDYDKWKDTNPDFLSFSPTIAIARVYPIYSSTGSTSGGGASADPKAISNANTQAGSSFLSGGSTSSSSSDSGGSGGSCGSDACGGGCGAGIVLGIFFFFFLCFLGYDWYVHGPDGYVLKCCKGNTKNEPAVAPDAAKTAAVPVAKKASDPTTPALI